MEFVETEFPFASQVPNCEEGIGQGDQIVALIDEYANDNDDCDAGRTCHGHQSLE